ncbi:FAD-dependent oxidoreductase [Paenibacillus sp. CGMCC 1.16610]|uniref:NADH oxidase n=1 Tax=Paenibacillus anseongense TaxID=2682845 RepID=A0ABW9U9Y4_9BACL|nr:MULTISPECIES: FAD-dependent oxidoreductase [Paenibacillus]MBA2937149.1 FAD-dependent oxidoreductase [Paenibacillus sp. CGMCC 1.16610]MVQ36211.1 NADH oxidase [Paenibacillus anseongense]
MKIVIVGCTHAGTEATKNLARLYPDAEISVYERNDNVSFLSCGIALNVGGIVKQAEDLFYSSPEELSDLGVNMFMLHEVLEINAEKKELHIHNMVTNERFTDTYDKLVMTTGSWPIIPDLRNIELNNILLCKNYSHALTIIEKAKYAKNITVIGAGYIGIELVEAFEHLGKSVTLIDNMDRILFRYLDSEVTDTVEVSLSERGICLALGQTVTGFEGEDGAVTTVVTNNNQYTADLVVLCIGFRPNTYLLNGQVDMLPNGAFLVDEYMRTSNPDIFAAGDSCAVLYNPTGVKAYIPLATNAVRMGSLVARNLLKPTVKYLGTQGTSAIKIYDHHIASTGLTETAALALGMEVKSVVIEENYRPEFMPSYEKATLKVVYEENGKRIIGAQVFSKADLTQSINTLSVCIQNRMTMDELAYVDFFFQPHYNKPWNILNLPGLEVEQALRRM